MASDDGGNTPVTDTTRTAPAEAAPVGATARQYLLERVDDAAVVQLYADVLCGPFVGVLGASLLTPALDRMIGPRPLL